MEAIKKRKKTSLENLKKEFADNRVILGSKRTLKLLKKNKIKKIYVSSTPPESLLELQEIGKVEIEKVKLNSLELGKYLGKSFPVAIVGIIKNENVR